jgi:hypothetical protein
MLLHGNNIDVFDSFAAVNRTIIGCNFNKFNTADSHLWVNLNTPILSSLFFNNSGIFSSVTIKKFLQYDTMVIHCRFAHACDYLFHEMKHSKSKLRYRLMEGQYYLLGCNVCGLVAVKP